MNQYEKKIESLEKHVGMQEDANKKVLRILLTDLIGNDVKEIDYKN